MKVIPAIDVKSGRCVQLVGGKPGTEKVQIEDVLGVARGWESEGAEMIHIIDLDSALGTGNNEQLIEKVAADLSIPVQVGGGVRTEDKVQRLFNMGCERVIIGTRAIQDRPFIQRMSSEYPDAIVVAIDSVANEIVIHGWQESSGKELLAVAKDLAALSIFGFLYTNVEIEGRLMGIDPVPIQALLNAVDKPLIVSGGITTIDDLNQLRSMNVHSAVVGMAIYTGKIEFRKAVRLFG